MFSGLGGGIAFHPKQRWYYYPFMTTKEVLVFHQYSEDTFFAKLSPKSIALMSEFLETLLKSCPVLGPPNARLLEPKIEFAESIFINHVQIYFQTRVIFKKVKQFFLLS